MFEKNANNAPALPSLAPPQGVNWEEAMREALKEAAKAEAAADAIRARFGKDAIIKGRALR